MHQPFGQTLKFRLSAAPAWLSLGPGWAAIAGILASGYPELTLANLLQAAGLWVLADPVLGTLWDLAVRQGVWQRLVRAQLPPPPVRGFSVPYAQPGTPAGRLALLVRRYNVWWRGSYWPAFGSQVITFSLGIVLALIIGAALGQAVFWLTVLSLCLILFASLKPIELAAAGGGRLQAVVQLLLPWLMGSLLWSSFSLPVLALAACYWATYLGGLRMLGGHRRAELLFFSGQIGAMLLLFGLRLLPGAVSISILLIAQRLIWNRFNQPAVFLAKIQPYLVLSVVIAGLVFGSLWG